MAPNPQGPGWWQASDGQWYPPESHPNYRSPSQPAQPVAPPTVPQAPVPQAQVPQAPPSPQFPQGPPIAPQSGPPAAGGFGPPPLGGQYTSPGQYTPGQYPQQGQYVQQSQYPQQSPYGQQGQYPILGPNTPIEQKKSKAPWIVLGLTLVVVIALLGGLFVAATSQKDSTIIAGRKDNGSTTGGGVETPSLNENAPSTDGAVSIIGPSNGPENDVISATIADLDEWWTKEMPDVYGIEFEPITGGYYSWSNGETIPPCVDRAEDLAGNAFYCSDGDLVAWDDEGLMPDLYKNFGDLSVAVVIAHEWGHAIQFRSNMKGATVTFEQQADCFAGAWVGHVESGDSEYFSVDGSSLDRALAGFLELADSPGTSASDPNAHGSAFDRINSFQEGLEDGAAACAKYTDATVGPRLVELQFQSQQDFDSGGNAPYDEIIQLTSADLEDYWRVIAEDKFGATWVPLEAAQPFDARTEDTPACGDADTSGYTLFYCADGRFVAYDDANPGLFRDVYDAMGDFAVAALYGSQYSLAAQDAFGISPDDVRDQNLMADCMTGSWAASVFLRDRTTGELVLSPGDFDEAVKVLLALGAEDSESNQGTGFERVKEFRDGVVGGIDACTP